MGAKRKTINKVIETKMNNWIYSIEDLDLQKQIKKDVIVTGGCITSLFQGEKINDFDVYFKTLKTAYDVSEYYAQVMNQERYDGEDVVQVQVVQCDDYGIPEFELSDDGDEIYEDFSSDEDILSYTPEQGKDVKYRVRCFIQSCGVAGDAEREDKELEEVLEENSISKTTTKEQKSDYSPVFITSNAITLTNDVQIVVRFFGEPDVIHENYDFQHTTNYWTYKTGLVTNERALECILSKELLYRGSRYPLASILRSRKFIQRGWKINAGQYLKMVFQLNQMDLEDPKVLENQLTGVDISYMHSVIFNLNRKLQEEPDLSVRDYFIEVVERIFD